MATDVEKEQQYVVDGAIFKCDCGSAPCQITAISNQKVNAQGKAIVTDKDVTFKLPSAPFVTCSKNTQTPPTCVYANGIWKTQTTVQQGDQNAIVEKSIMNCPVFGGEIKCIYTGQVQSVSAPELAEFKIETLSNFPLALVVTPPAKKQEDKKKNVSSVYHVSASKEYVRPDEVITLHALDKGKKELKPTDIVNWAVTTRKKTEETVKGKTVSKECIDKLTLIKKVCTPFNISFHEPGIYYIEGGSDKIADEYSALKTDQQLVIEKGKKKPPFDENCKAVVEVLEKNRIVGIRLKGDYIKGEDDDTIFLKNSDNLEIIVRTAVDLESHEKLSLLINKHLTKESAKPLYNYVAQNSNEYSFTLKPSFFNDNKKTVDITLTEETPYSINYLPIGTIDSKSITVEEVDGFVSAFVSLDKDGSKQIQKDSFLRPKTPIYLIVRPTEQSDKNVDLSKAIWTIKEKHGSSIVKGNFCIHSLTFEGEVTISLDLSKCDTVINANDKGVTQASFSFNVSRNVIKGIVRTPKVLYPNIDYWINFDMLYKYDKFKDKEVSFFLDGDEIKAESDSHRVIFDKDQIGMHSIYYSEKGKFEFEVREANIEKWQFVDEHHNKISEVGFDEPFYLEIKVPAWKDIKNEKGLDNVRIFLWDNNAKDPTPIKISALDDARFGKDGNAFIKLSISKQDIKVDGRKKINIIASLINPPYTDVVNLSKMKGYDSHWVCSKSSPLTLTTETCVTGFFSGKSGNPQKSVMKYGDSIFIMLATHNCKEITDRIKVELVENNKVGEKDDTVIAVYDNLEFGNNGKVKIDISEHFKNEDVHGDNPNPRLFFFGVKLDDAVIYTYPQSHEDVFNMTFKKKCEVTATKELQDSPSAEESEQKESECEESDTTVITQGEENYSITKGEKSNDNGWNKKIRSYLWQLKVGKDKEIQRLNHSLTNIAPVVVGEELKKGEKNTESGCKCPRCRESAEDMEMRLKKIFPNTNVAKEIAEAYCEFQYKLRMDSCWIKAAFFSNGVIESNIGRDGIPKTEGGSYTRERLEDIKPSKIFKGKWKNGKWESDTNKKGERIYKSDSIKAQLDNIFKKTGKEKEKAIFSFMYAGENGNGNYESGDGWKYRGGSYTQITHKNTYSKIKKILESIGYENVGDLNADSFEGNIRLAVAASMAFFRYKHGNMHALCDGVIKHDDINFDAPNSYEDVKLIEKAFNVVGNDVKYESSFTDSKGGKISFKKNHQGKMLFFKDVAYDAFQLKDCECNKVDVGTSGMITFHIYSNGRIEKHYPDDITDDKHYRYVYHPDSGEGYEVAVRKIQKNVPNFVSCEKIKEGDLSKEIKGAVEISGFFKDGVDGKKIYAHYDKNNEIDYVVCDGYLDGITRRIYKYKTDKKKIELVRMDEVDESKGEKDQDGLLYFYQPGKVFIYYRIIMDKTQRYYADAIQFAAFIGILAHYGNSKLGSIPADFECKTPNEKDMYGRTGMGNTDIMGIGYPSVSHRQGMGFDYSYGTKEEDKILIEGAKMFGFRKRNLNCGYEKSHIREGCYSIGGHETHIHMGPMNDSSATLKEAYEDTMDSHGKTEIYREVNKKA